MLFCLIAPGPTGIPGDGGGYSMMMVMFGWLVVATALFLLRPQSLRRVTGDQKPNRSDHDVNLYIFNFPSDKLNRLFF